MSDLLCLFTQEANYGTYYDSHHAVILVAAPDMVAAQRVAAAHAKGTAGLLWGPCKIIKGARISGDAGVVSVIG